MALPILFSGLRINVTDNCTTQNHGTILPGFGVSRHIWCKKLQSNLGSMRFYEYVPPPNRKMA
jgi:hypothetical protein